MDNIFIFTEGGGETGMGHISRCLSLYQAFEMLGYFPQFIINGNESVVSAVSGTRYQLFDWIAEVDKTITLLRDAGIVLIDSYKCPAFLYQLIKNESKTAVYIDDNLRLEYPSGIVVNGVMGAEQLGYKKRDDIDYLLGAQYAFLRSSFWNVPLKEINPEVKSIFISCGGNDNGLSARIVKILSEQFPWIYLSVVVKDNNSPEISKLKLYAQVLTALSADEMKALLGNADLAITAAGQTTYELCRIGTPFVALLTADNQAYSIGNFFKQGLVQEVIDPNNPAFDTMLVNQINYFLDPETRKAISSKMQTAIDGSGSLKLADYIINYTTLS
ncbi:hypothetical protein [Sediminibacterium sp.]|uniref:PseG/SpsG family protein n=1 Tax=Sediminibacterium sp. TaxID=1917865 RepID=UPI0025F7585D|nr:hypothetical protein [Sediminibacterium sp.]MBT9485443.1 UDP-2,4-diacetamido-2,4,6-trideoxy-beta-L-altropyranose hydrolase [Sediminibacterium sp.]